MPRGRRLWLGAAFGLLTLEAAAAIVVALAARDDAAPRGWSTPVVVVPPRLPSLPSTIVPAPASVPATADRPASAKPASAAPAPRPALVLPGAASTVPAPKPSLGGSRFELPNTGSDTAPVAASPVRDPAPGTQSAPVIPLAPIKPAAAPAEPRAALDPTPDGLSAGPASAVAAASFERIATEIPPPSSPQASAQLSAGGETTVATPAIIETASLRQSEPLARALAAAPVSTAGDEGRSASAIAGPENGGDRALAASPPAVASASHRPDPMAGVIPEPEPVAVASARIDDAPTRLPGPHAELALRMDQAVPAPLFVAALSDDGSQALAEHSAEPLRVTDLTDIFARLDEAGALGEKVEILIRRLPADLADTRSDEIRKTVFLRALVPIIVAENEKTMARRRLVLARAGEMERADLAEDPEIQDIAREMELERFDLDELLSRLDAVPPSLALAQAAQESGWGTSRVAQAGNALFGEMRFASETGPNGITRVVARVREFDHLPASVAAYIHNLNTHAAYADFRRERARLRAAGAMPTGHALARYLGRYSELGHAYIRMVRAVIRDNDLEAYDVVGGDAAARFGSGRAARPATGERDGY